MSAFLALALKSSKKSAFLLKRILDPFRCVNRIEALSGII